MVKWVLQKIMGSKNQREVKRLWPVVQQINEFEQQYQKLSDDQLRAKTAEFKQRIANGATGRKSTRLNSSHSSVSRMPSSA